VTAGFRFADLFAGIGGFHAALSAMGGRCVYAVEVDPGAARIYERNWGINPLGDITRDANDSEVRVPRHDVLCAGFPCQPFSKSGAQRGMDETRGTLFWNIMRVVQVRRPAVVLLENVRNLAGPRHRHEWQVIIDSLKAEGYRVSETPAIFSPHLLHPGKGGRPQVRERVFISATRLPRNWGNDFDPDVVVTNRRSDDWDPRTWNLETDLPLELNHEVEGCELSVQERLWIDAWDEFVQLMREARAGRRLPGFPLWADEWIVRERLKPKRLQELPKWKADFLIKNSEFYSAYKHVIDPWAKSWGIYTDAFPPSRRKLEWQAQDAPRLWDCVLHFRPSGIRAKRPSYLPALVAMTQTSIIGPRERRLSPREAARLQGLPDWFDFLDQSPTSTYRQLGNGVSVGAVWHVLKRHADRDEDLLKKINKDLLSAIKSAGDSPDPVLKTMRPADRRSH